MRIRTLTALATTAAIALAGVGATASSALAASPQDYDNAVLQIKTHGGLLLDVEGASRSDGARVIQWTPNGGDNQRWRFVRVGDHHQIRSVNSGKCLTVALDGSSRVEQWVCRTSRLSQQWDVEPGTFSSTVLSGLNIRSVSTGLPLTATDVFGQQVSVKNSLLGDDPEQVFDFVR